MGYPQTDFIFTSFPPGSFWGRRRDIVRKTTLIYQLQVLKHTGRYDAFRLNWHPIYSEPIGMAWPVPRHLFWDSDVAKWIESACYFLMEEQDETIDQAVKELVDMIRAAQHEDGYLNIHFSVIEPEKRWTNLRDMHELYNAGHLIEAALIHQQLYKDNRLLGPIIHYVHLIHSRFGSETGNIPGYPGHPEIELALLRLFALTHDGKSLELAEFFLRERGNPTGCEGRPFYQVEAERRGEPPFQRPAHMPHPDSSFYNQAHLPILKQDTVEGHSVRAMYLLTAVADLSRTSPKFRDDGYLARTVKLWDNMVGKKMYLTGGIGAIAQWEGFGIDYFLPQSTDEGGCYAETCAAIGVMMLAQRLLEVDLNHRYSDIMELCLYNAVLTAMSYDGKRFTYVNQLASSDVSPSKREEWFDCACCPPNMTRTFGMLGGYLWNHHVAGHNVTVDVHLYTNAELNLSEGDSSLRIRQSTKWPLDGLVKFTVDKPEHVDLTLRLRIPHWAEGYTVGFEPNLESPIVEKGYITLPNNWLSQSKHFTVNIHGFIPRLLSPHPFTNQNTVAVARGPLVYCVEDVDNPWVKDHFKSTAMHTGSKLVEERKVDLEVGDEYIAIRAIAAGSFVSLDPWDHCAAMPTPATESGSQGPRQDLVFVPYYYRANRAGRGQMRVGLKKGC
ncbi:DUF1680-domain-containing protein [Aspergillus steynii IBT 23096]|uniref:DUF1680-domain-containing protein n=1 Tax=Aspergillus steynii IBT 23096 TaxID=1392250 RepID=A0A2I2G3E5_9EURO|nr:DUF1680-domain-containing protein [Aspergillus steynii IBT 23096]PLB47394.1 DUF1680-domain-containing protein [Aspergillus steynii IBT 23096]